MATRKREDELDPTGTKRMKTEGGFISESKVIYVKGVPMNAVESDLLALASPFGAVANVLLIAAKRQGFIQMADLDGSVKLMQHYMGQQAYIQAQPVTLQYSNRTEITNGKQANTLGGQDQKSGGAEVPSTVLLVNILNARLQVTVDNLYQVFSVYGPVNRIVTFQKPGASFKALVEFARLPDTLNAKRALEGKDMFQDPYMPTSGCCTLKLSFSSTKAPLTVRANDQGSRDYTTPQQGLMNWGQGMGMGGMGGLAGQQSANPYLSQQSGFGSGQQASLAPSSSSRSPGCVLLVSNLPEGKVPLVEGKITPDHLFTLFGVYGDVIRVKILFNKKSTAMIQMDKPHQAALAIQHLNGVDLFGQKVVVSLSKNPEVQLPSAASLKEGESPLTKDFTGSKLHRFRLPDSKNSRHICPPGTTLHVSNLDVNITEIDLKQLFEQGLDEKEAAGVSVAFFVSKEKKMAYVTMPSISSAVGALIRNHNLRRGEKNLRVTFSRPNPKVQGGAAAAVTGALPLQGTL